ncbi:MAG: Mrp/NBP35 family ATP-binding protein [Bdellovibrionaceae bacterium]|nr:Mrp/NBP35 family ATP-binding protein [Pseudobdellovibrionaceae bacterium]
MANPFDEQKPIPGVKHIIAISSGKGGVGKSTLSTHLAMALKARGLKVGLLDADIYGPSIPRMMGTMNHKPELINNLLSPIEAGGVQTLSMGNLVEEDLAVVWRGPMLFKAMNQFLFEVDWKDLDILLVDLPPGTGDVQLSLAQKIPLRGVICVTTPQNVALADVKKSIDMFRRVNIPILGLVENMAYMQIPGSGEKLQLYPKGDLQNFIEKENIQKIGEIPMNPEIGRNCEIGLPLTFKADAETNKPFMDIAERVYALIY